MSWTDVLKTYGLQKPYCFRIAIPLLLNLIGIILVLAVCILLFVDRGLDIGTERFYFFCYLVALLLVAAGFSRITILSFAILSWCTVELSLAFVSGELERHGLMNSLFPENIFSTAPDPRVELHPVLGMVNKPNSHGEWHFNRRNAALVERNDWIIPVNPSFFAENIYSHNSLGFRGKELTANDLKKELIFVDGGSTTYDWTVTQGATWVERLEADLNHKFTVVNFGVTGHSTAQHLIHTAFYHNVLKKKPICAVYYVGWNELYNFNTPDLDPTYANRSSLILHEYARRPDLWAAKYSPVMRLADKTARRRFDSVPELSWGGNVYSASTGIPRDARLEEIFVGHIEAITAINNSRGTKTVFIEQMLNRELFQRRPHARDFSVFVENESAWPMQERLNSVLEHTAVRLGAKYIDPGIENFRNNDFTDIGHFSADGARKFASLIAERVESYCQ